MGNLCFQAPDSKNQEQKTKPNIPIESSQPQPQPQPQPTEIRQLPEKIQKQVLRIATLNYCGIMNSPFEFYCSDFYAELDKISDIFVSLIPKYFPDFEQTKFNWNLGKVDHKMRKGRYSPMFSPNAGIVNGVFISKSDFQKQWEKVFKVQVVKIKDMTYTEQEKRRTIQYDVLMYHTLLKYVFHVETIEEAKNLNVKDYLKVIQPFFEVSFLDQQKKLEKLKTSFTKIDADVFIFEEYSQYFYQYLEKQEQYYLSADPSGDTLIIAKKQVFTKQKSCQDNEAQIKLMLTKFNLPGTIAVMIVDKYIIFGVHLTSKVDKNKEQVEGLKKGLIDLKKQLEKNKIDFEIILGGDLNSYFPHFSNKFTIFPQQGGELTTIKKRTMTQGQYHKGRKLVEQSKDKILSSLPMIRGSIKYITNEDAQKNSLVPNDKHPFDHFVVVAQLKTKN